MTTKTKKRILLFATAPLLLLLIVVFGCHFIVVANASSRTFDSVDNIPHNRYGLLLATSPITPAGEKNPPFDARIDAATELFKAGKIDYIIASGGNYTATETFGCNEPIAIRDSLVARGIPIEAVLLDYEGTRTLNSIAKVKKQINIDSITFISQKYHNQRAIYLADHYDIFAVGYNADNSPDGSQRFKNSVREYFARVKLFVDIISGKDFNPTSPFVTH